MKESQRSNSVNDLRSSVISEDDEFSSILEEDLDDDDKEKDDSYPDLDTGSSNNNSPMNQLPSPKKDGKSSDNGKDSFTRDGKNQPKRRGKNLQLIFRIYAFTLLFSNMFCFIVYLFC